MKEQDMNTAKSNAFAFAILSILVCLCGCATVVDDAYVREQAVQHSEQRLAQREHELVRARSDLAHFRTTLRHLREHETGWTGSSFNPYLVRFLEERVDPLVSNEWQSGHPELAQLDVDLRLLRAEALLDMNMKRDASRAIRDIVQNYEGQEQMLVTNAYGERATLEDSLSAFARKLNRD